MRKALETCYEKKKKNLETHQNFSSGNLIFKFVKQRKSGVFHTQRLIIQHFNMSRSTLSIELSSAQLVERLNDDDCMKVIRLIQNEIGASTLNKMVTHIILRLTQSLSLSDKSLIKLEKTIKETY